MSSNFEFLEETTLLNYNHPEFTVFLSDLDLTLNITQQVIQYYKKVRDHFLYDPYHLDLRPDALRGSQILTKRRAWCVEKAIVFAAGVRRLGVPSRLGYAIVQNHIGVEKLESYLRRKEIVFHGYVDVFLNGQWFSCTPAFDKRICRISGVPPLDFDGMNNSMFQAYSDEKQFMEYLHYYGTFPDVPVKLMNAEMKKYYPHLFETEWNSKEFSFHHE